jgi:hypothetical protein
MYAQGGIYDAGDPRLRDDDFEEKCLELCCWVPGDYADMGTNAPAVPRARTPPHCRVDGIGREFCQTSVCLLPAGGFVMPGPDGQPLTAWPRFTDGLIYDPRTQTQLETLLTFDFPRGFEWSPLIEESTILGFRLSEPIFNEISRSVSHASRLSDVIIIGWPGTANENIFHFLQYAFGLLVAQLRYQVTQWSGVILSDPGNWLSLSDWHKNMFELLLGNYNFLDWRSFEATTCFESAVFPGWSY